MTKRLLVGLLFCVSFWTSVLPGSAQIDRDSDPIVKLGKAGWKIVEGGVLQRQTKPNETETFVFGVQGFTWKLQELNRQMAVLQKEFKANSTPELWSAIASHRHEIASTRKAIQRARAAEARGEAILPKTDCTITYAYEADASFKPDREGTWAEASADFNVASGCGFSGEVYAYAFAKTTVGGAPTTATVTDGPRTGSNVNASADANRNGGPPCESYAFSSVTSNSLNPSSYSVSKSNGICPVRDENGFYYCPRSVIMSGWHCIMECWCVESGRAASCSVSQDSCTPP
jgi:hypothetical protein